MNLGEREKQQLEKAIENEKVVASLFIDRRGEQDVVTVDCGDDEGDQSDAFVLLHEECTARSGGPFFEAAYVLGGVLSKDGNEISFDDLPKLLDDAESERQRFYAEREQAYGGSAWPAS